MRIQRENRWPTISKEKALEETSLANTWFQIWVSKIVTNNFCLALAHLVCGTLLYQPKQINISSLKETHPFGNNSCLLSMSQTGIIYKKNFQNMRIFPHWEGWWQRVGKIFWADILYVVDKTAMNITANLRIISSQIFKKPMFFASQEWRCQYLK